MRRNLFILGLSLWLLLPQVAAFGDDFDADKTIGIAPLTVHFLLDCEAWTYFQQWSFGDGTTLNERNPEHTYTKPGTYQVTVVYRHAGGLFDLTKTEFITVYPPCGLAPLKVVDGTPTVPNEDWSNAIDGDTNNNDGTVSALNGPAQAIFEFSDSQIRKITKIRLLSNSDIQYFHAIQQMSLAVSENGTNHTDFTEISTSSVVQRGWTEINFPEISARYIKLTVNDQNSLPRRFNEFEVYTQFVPIDSQRSYLQISTPQVANGVDRAQITLFLFDAANQPITGKHQADINFHITGQNNYLHDFREVAPGQYVAYLTSMTAEEKYVSAYINGMPVLYTATAFSRAPRSRPMVEFVPPVMQRSTLHVVDSSITNRNEGWYKAFDTRTEGDGCYVSAGGNPPYATVEFNEKNIQWINQLRMKTKANIQNEWMVNWVKRIQMLVSTTDLENSSFTEVLTRELTTGDWVEFTFPAVAARYIKFVILRDGVQQWGQISEIEVYTVPQPTPVELINFELKALPKAIAVKWSTASESKNYGFEIQRRDSQSDYISVGFMVGNGTSAEFHDYEFIDQDIANAKYYYRLKQIDLDGSVTLLPEKTISFGLVTDFTLDQNYPNPFNPETRIRYHLPEAGETTVTIKNLLGQEIKRIVAEYQSAGTHQVIWDGTDNQGQRVASGRYLYAVSTPAYQAVKTMTLLK